MTEWPDHVRLPDPPSEPQRPNPPTPPRQEAEIEERNTATPWVPAQEGDWLIGHRVQPDLFWNVQRQRWVLEPQATRYTDAQLNGHIRLPTNGTWTHRRTDWIIARTDWLIARDGFTDQYWHHLRGWVSRAEATRYVGGDIGITARPTGGAWLYDPPTNPTEDSRYDRAPRINPDVDNWQRIGDSYFTTPSNVLLQPLYIYDTYHHMTAMRVADDGSTYAYDSAYQSDLDTAYNLYAGDAWNTVTIPGFIGQYVIFIHPGS